MLTEAASRRLIRGQIRSAAGDYVTKPARAGESWPIPPPA